MFLLLLVFLCLLTTLSFLLSNIRKQQQTRGKHKTARTNGPFLHPSQNFYHSFNTSFYTFFFEISFSFFFSAVIIISIKEFITLSFAGTEVMSTREGPHC